MWHSFTGKYNTYYNATLAYVDASLEKENGNKDNYTEMLPLFYVGNKSSAKLGSGNYDRAIEKCEKTIKLHSIKKRPEWTKKRRKTERDIEWLSRKEYNPMMWKAWLLMGRAQFHKGDFDAAAATFSYMSRLYQTQPAIYGQARAWLARCYAEQEWLYDAEDIIKKAERDSMHWKARREWNYTYADYYIRSGAYEKAIPYLQDVIKKERRNKQKSRELFLLGQLYARTGNDAEAYKAFKRVVKLNPPYELELNARIAMTEVMAEKQSGKMISKLKRMVRNDNNKEYLDQVYYALGNIHMARHDTLSAISAYEKGNKQSTRNGIEKGVLLLRLGDIYWDMEKYSDAGRCYGEAIGLLDKDRDDYDALADRSKKLDQLIPYTEAVHLQDSLQALASMSEKERNEAIDRVITELKKKEKEEKDAKAMAAAENTINKNGQQKNDKRPGMQPPTMQKDNNGTWYFYNQMAVNQGKQAFIKQWGKRANEDHWQRSNQSVVKSFSDSDAEANDVLSTDSVGANNADMPNEVSTDSIVNDPYKREYYLAQIPFSEEQKTASDQIIMDGLYNSGVLFKDKLNNLRLSERQLSRLEKDYPGYENRADLYYHMFLLYSRLGDSTTASTYIAKLQNEYADHQWTLLLTDPNFADNQRFGIHIEDSLYAASYTALKEDNFDIIQTNVKISQERFPQGANRDKFIFISGLSKLNMGDIDGCLDEMNALVKDHAQSKMAEIAGMIINGVKAGRKLYGGRFDMNDVWAKRAAMTDAEDSTAVSTFSKEINNDHVIMMVFAADAVDSNKLLYALAKYNFSNYMSHGFDIETDVNDNSMSMCVKGFGSYQKASVYLRECIKQHDLKELIAKGKTYIISAENLALIGSRFNYDDYEKFYSENIEAEITHADTAKDDEQEAGEALDDGGSMPAGLLDTNNNKKETADDKATDDGSNTEEYSEEEDYDEEEEEFFELEGF